MDTISIITVTFNAEKVLEKTLKNILAQTYPKIELIVIDGKSTDNTLKIIQKYESQIDFWQSQADKGIYDAMNKGIQKAAGDWVIFMNAGDEFSTKKSLENAFQNIPENIAIIYGNYKIIYKTIEKSKKVPSDLRNIREGMQLNHQSILIRKNVIQAFLFNIKYSLAADYEQIVRLYRADKKFHYVDCFIANFADGGQSATQKVNYLNQVREISKQYFPDFREIDVHFDRQIQKTQQIEKLKSILPTFMFEFLMNLKHKLT